jgi:hypothetical protein
MMMSRRRARNVSPQWSIVQANNQIRSDLYPTSDTSLRQLSREAIRKIQIRHCTVSMLTNPGFNNAQQGDG